MPSQEKQTALDWIRDHHRKLSDWNQIIWNYADTFSMAGVHQHGKRGRMADTYNGGRSVITFHHREHRD